MFWVRSVCISAFICVICGCSSLSNDQVGFTYRSHPPGASIYEGDTFWGVAPQKRIYQSLNGQKLIQTREVTAVWPSGARAIYSTALPVDGREFEVTIHRPNNEPGIEKDWEWASSIERSNAAKAEADRAATNAAIGGFIEGFNANRRKSFECWNDGIMVKCK